MDAVQNRLGGPVGEHDSPMPLLDKIGKADGRHHETGGPLGPGFEDDHPITLKRRGK
jgi:hypothetical protein